MALFDLFGVLRVVSYNRLGLISALTQWLGAVGSAEFSRFQIDPEDLSTRHCLCPIASQVWGCLYYGVATQIESD